MLSSEHDRRHTRISHVVRKCDMYNNCRAYETRQTIIKEKEDWRVYRQSFFHENRYLLYCGYSFLIYINVYIT